MAEVPDTPRATPAPDLHIAVTAEDAGTGWWMRHALTRRVLWGGGSLAVSAIAWLAMAWGGALLENVKGAREDAQAVGDTMQAAVDKLQLAIDKIDERMTMAEQERRALALSDAAKTESMRALDARITSVEAKCEAGLYGRYDLSLRNYEKRHGISEEAPDRTR